jgi:adenylate kinase
MTRIVACVGLSGVGKSTLIKSLAERIKLQHLSAGRLIGDEKARRQEAQQHDELRLADIGDNQKLLIEGFRRKLDRSASVIIIDGHTVIDTDQTLEPIHYRVFKALGIEMFIFLQAEPTEILQRRMSDASRTRPVISVKEIERHQEFAIEVTKACAGELSIPCYIVVVDDFEFILGILKS